MAIDKATVTDLSDIEVYHRDVHPKYEYFKKVLLDGDEGDSYDVSVLEVPPGKSAYPYHWHHRAEETFYIISGVGDLRTPDGTKTVKAGDFCVFPPGPAGAHKLTNTGDVALVYIDFDTYHDPDIATQPDTGKTVIYGRDIYVCMRDGTSVDYYDGEQ